MPENPVELSDLFDPDSKVDRWVFMLAAVMADLAAMESTFKAAVHGEDSHPAHRFYRQRQLSARIFEASRVVLAIRATGKSRSSLSGWAQEEAGFRIVSRTLSQGWATWRGDNSGSRGNTLGTRVL